MTDKQEGIKPSKKYANGTFHENASGRFQILDRFLGKDGVIYLKIQWVVTGQIETNKEVNVSASIWKYEKARGKVNPPEEKPPIPEVTFSDILEKIETLEEYLHDAHGNREGILDSFKKLQEDVHDLREQVKDKNAKIDRLLEMQKTNQEQITILIKQNDLASKLIEKM
jgi:hypothetical protein